MERSNNLLKGAELVSGRAGYNCTEPLCSPSHTIWLLAPSKEANVSVIRALF
jgi:hypothetical protein